MEIPVVIQHRHVHLSEQDAQILFGYKELQSSRPLEQHGQFVSKELVGVHGPDGSFPEVCVIGPIRSGTQVELSASDAFAIGVDAPVRVSGDLDRTASVILKTTHGKVRAKMSTIIPIRHLHLPPSAAEQLRLLHHDIVSVKIKNRDDLVFDNVVLRVHPMFTPAFHLTKDEAATHWILTGDIAIL